MALLHKFVRDRSGNFAILAALMATPLILAVGFGIDGSRYYSARENLQDAVDTAALALAASTEQDVTVLRQEGEKFIAANISDGAVAKVAVSSLSADTDKIQLSATGQIQTTFMQLASVDTMTVAASALAMRAPVRAVEIALVLDNTWSMSETSGGVRKIDTLKQASSDLVKTLITDGQDDVSIGIVPYADYVNVGVANRNASWLSVPEDYSVDAAPRTCVTKSTKNVCLARSPTYECTRTVDGVEEPATCGGSCTTSETQTVAPYQSCSGGGNPTNYKWFGCIGSRMSGTTRLNDLYPTTKYPGYVETSQKCLTEIQPLTKNKTVLNTAINNMIIDRGSGYRPYTYIPAGLIWGQNILSPTEPFTDGAAYDTKNVSPRKIMILMTDGDNTLKFRSSDGRHVGFSANASAAKTQFETTNSETQSICDYSKSKDIDIYTVAFMVDNADARNLLQNCATDSVHYFDASNREMLLSAFSGIARSISQVRLAQ